MGACHSLDSDDSLDSRGSLSGSVGEGGSFYESGLGMGGLANGGVSLIRVRTGTGRIEPTFTCEELDLHPSLSPSPSPSPSPLDSPEYYHHNGSIWSNVEPFMSPATVTLAVFDEAQFQQHPQQHHSSRLLRRSTDGKDGPSSNLNLGGGGSSSTDHKNWHRPSSRWLVEATKNALPHSSYESSNFTSQSAPSSSLHPPHHLASTTQQPNLSGTGSGSGNGHAHGNGAQYSGSLLNSRHLTLTSESSTPTAPLRTLNQQGGKGYFGLRLTQSHSQELSSFSSPQSSPSHHQLISSTAAAAAAGGSGGGVIPLPSTHSRQTSVDDQRTQLLLSAALGWTGNAINVPHQLSRNTLASEQQRASSRSATPRRLKYTSLRVSTANASFLAMIADANRTANFDGTNTNATTANNNNNNNNASTATTANSNGASVIVAPSHASSTPTPMSSEMLALVPGMANASPAQSKRRDLKIDIHAALSTNPDSPLPTPSRAPSHLSVAAFKKVYAQMYAKAQERMQHAAAIQAQQQQQQQQYQHQSHTHQLDASQLVNGAPTPTPNSLADDTPLMDRDPSLASSLALQHRQDQARRLQQTDRAQAILVATGGLLHLPKQHYRSHSRSHSHGDLKNPSAEVIQALLQSQQSTTATTTAATVIASSTTGCTPTDTTMTTTMATHSTSALTPTETPPPVTHDTDRSHQAPPPNSTVVLTPVLPVTPDAYETTSSASMALQQYMTPSNILNDDTPQFHEAYKQWFREEILRERLMRKQLPRNHSPSRSLFSTPRLNSFDGEAIEVEPLHADAHGELHTPPGCRTPVGSRTPAGSRTPVGSRTPGSSRTPAGTLTAFAVLRESNSCNGSGSNTPMPLMSNAHESEKIGSLLGIGHDSPQSTRLAVTPLQLLNQWRATHNVAKTAPTTPTKVNTAKVR